MVTFTLLVLLKPILLNLLGQFLPLLLVYVAMEMFGGVAEGRRHQDLSILAQLITDLHKEVLQLDRILKYLRVSSEKHYTMDTINNVLSTANISFRSKGMKRISFHLGPLFIVFLGQFFYFLNLFFLFSFF